MQESLSNECPATTPGKNGQLPQENGDAQRIACEIGLIGKGQNGLLAKLFGVSQVNAEVLLVGETGVGKELYARYVHRCSPRWDREFVAVNCAAIPDSLFENEFFGHNRGAYTDATTQAEGLISFAEGGTLFLDEVHQLSSSGQVKLLRLLQEKEFRRVGDRTTRKANFRVVSAMNRDPLKLIEEGKLRRDLYHRLNVVKIPIPPLRERSEDILELSEFFFKRYCDEFDRDLKISDGALRALYGYDWPGNIRELQNMIKSVVCQHTNGLIDESMLPIWNDQNGEPDTFIRDRIGSLSMLPFHEAKKQLVEEFEKLYITEMLRKANGNVCRAARFSGKPVRSFRRTMDERGIDVSRFRTDGQASADPNEPE